MRAAGIIAVAGLAACSAAPEARGSLAGVQPVEVEGQRFAASLGAGPAGERLTAAGARPVPGLAVVVRREGAALHYSDGAAAKKAARAACEARGGRFEPVALGRVTAPGLWTFSGACA